MLQTHWENGALKDFCRIGIGNAVERSCANEIAFGTPLVKVAIRKETEATWSSKNHTGSTASTPTEPESEIRGTANAPKKLPMAIPSEKAGS